MAYYDPVADSKRLVLQAGVLGQADYAVLDEIWGRLGLGERELSVLDAGCGNGVVTEARFGGLSGVSVVALEPVVGAVAEATARLAGYEHVRVVQGSICDLGGWEETFDLVFCSLVLGWVEDWRAAVSSLWERVAPGGVLVARVSEDGLFTHWPQSDDLELLMGVADLPGAGERYLGRKLQGAMLDLAGAEEVEMVLAPVVVSARDTPSAEDRLAVFETIAGWRLGVVAALAEQRGDGYVELLARYEVAVEQERQRFCEDASMYACWVAMIGVAHKR